MREAKREKPSVSVLGLKPGLASVARRLRRRRRRGHGGGLAAPQPAPAQAPRARRRLHGARVRRAAVTTNLVGVSIACALAAVGFGLISSSRRGGRRRAAGSLRPPRAFSRPAPPRHPVA